MTQKIISVALNEKEYKKFLELKEYYTNDIYQLSNSEVFKVAMLKHLNQKMSENKN